jgi:hypothetical protein
MPNNPYPTTGTQEGDIKAGYINAGVYDPNKGSLTGTMSQPGSTGPADTGTKIPTTSADVGATGPALPSGDIGNSTAFALAMYAFNQNTQKNNTLMKQRQLLLKQIYDQPLTDEEKSQLDPTLLSAVNTNDRNQMDLSLRLISDELQGRTNTLDQSMKFLVDTYNTSVTQLETQKNDAINNVIKFVQQYGSDAGTAMKALYGQAYVDQLKTMGIDIDAFAKLPLTTIANLRYGAGSTTGGFPAASLVPGSAASVGNVSGLKSTSGTFKAYSDLSGIQSFNDTVADIQAKQKGQTSTGLNGDSTLEDFVNTWINGPNQGRQAGQGYTADDVASDLGVTANTKIGQLDANALAESIASHETGWTPSASSLATTATRPDPLTANVPDANLGGYTPQYVWDSALQLALDKSKSVQSFLGGLSGSTGPGKELKTAIANKVSAIRLAAGITNPALLQAQFTAQSKAITTQVTFMANVRRALDGAELGAAKTQELFASKGINVFDATWANTTLNDLVKKFGSSGDIRAYQSAMVEIGNEYAQVFARGGQRSQEGTSMAIDIVNGNVKLGDIQKTLDTLQAIGQTVLQSSVDTIAASASGEGTDELAKFYAYIYGANAPGTGAGISQYKSIPSSDVTGMTSFVQGAVKDKAGYKTRKEVIKDIKKSNPSYDINDITALVQSIWTDNLTR